MSASLAVVTCLFNPLRWRSRYALFDLFADAVSREGVPLYCVELLFKGQRSHAAERLPATTLVLGPEGHAQSVLFHKEALLNVGIARALADGFDYVAWLDADVTFSEAGWPGRILDAFAPGPDGRRPDLVQCFSRCARRFTDGVLREDSAAARFLTGAYQEMNRNPGGAWAVGRRFLERRSAAGVLYDKAILGEGDTASWLAHARAHARAEGLKIPEERFLRWSRSAPMLQRDWLRWADSLGDARVGCADLKITSHAHGSFRNRLYGLQRMSLNASYSPDKDVRSTPAGVLEWTGNNPQLENAVLRHFKSRREDEKPLRRLPLIVRGRKESSPDPRPQRRTPP